MMELVNPKEIYIYPMVDHVVVIQFDNVIELPEKFNDYDLASYTLQELIDELQQYHCFKILVEGGLSGAIYRYNNYGNGETYKIGDLCGYA